MPLRAAPLRGTPRWSPASRLGPSAAESRVVAPLSAARTTPRMRRRAVVASQPSQRASSGARYFVHRAAAASDTLRSDSPNPSDSLRALRSTIGTLVSMSINATSRTAPASSERGSGRMLPDGTVESLATYACIRAAQFVEDHPSNLAHRRTSTAERATVPVQSRCVLHSHSSGSRQSASRHGFRCT